MYRALQGRCGLYCGACEIYVAYSTDNKANLRRIADEKSKEHGRVLQAELVKCLGCKGPISSCWGASCKIRECAEARGIEFCYQCRDYPCEELESLFARKPVARDNLKMISKIGPDAWISAMMAKADSGGGA